MTDPERTQRAQPDITAVVAGAGRPLTPGTAAAESASLDAAWADSASAATPSSGRIPVAPSPPPGWTTAPGTPGPSGFTSAPGVTPAPGFAPPGPVNYPVPGVGYPPRGHYQPGGFRSGAPAPELEPAPSSSLAIITVILWRLALAGCAGFGLHQAMTFDGSRPWHWPNLYFFSQISTLLVGLTALGAVAAPLIYRGRFEGRLGILRGASTSYALVTALVFAFLMKGSYHGTGSRFEHLIVPALALVDWLCVGRNQTRVRWWMPMLWLLPFVAYLAVYISHAKTTGYSMYQFLLVDSNNFWTTVAMLMGGFLILFYVVFGLGHIKRAIPQKLQVVRQ